MRFAILFFIMLFLTSISLASATLEDWGDTNFERRIPIYVDNLAVNATITNVPVLMEFTGASSPYWATRTTNDYNDIKIQGVLGTTVYWADYEVLDWNFSTNTFRFIFKALELTPTVDDTKFYVYTNHVIGGNFDNPAGVWGTNALYVAHFIDDANDSSVNANHGVVSGATLTANTNFYGKNGYLFDGINDNIALPTGLFNGVTSMTLLAEIYNDYNNTDAQLYPAIVTSGWSSQGSFTWYLHEYPTNPLYRNQLVLGYSEGGSPAVMSFAESGTGTNKRIGLNNTYLDVAATWAQGGPKRVFIEGAQYGTTQAHVDQYALGNYWAYIGATGATGTGNLWQGYIGSVWIFSEVKSDAWINFVYLNRTSNRIVIGLSETQPLATIERGFYPTPAREVKSDVLERGRVYYYSEENFSQEDNYRGDLYIKLVNDESIAYNLEPARGTIYAGILTGAVTIPLDMPLDYYEALVEFQDDEEELAYRSTYTGLRVSQASSAKYGYFKNPVTYIRTYEDVPITVSVASVLAYEGNVTVKFINDESIIFTEVVIPVVTSANGSYVDFTRTIEPEYQSAKPTGLYQMTLFDDAENELSYVKVYIENTPESTAHKVIRNAIYPLSFAALLLGLYLGGSVVFRNWKPPPEEENKEIKIKLELYG